MLSRQLEAVMRAWRNVRNVFTPAGASPRSYVTVRRHDLLRPLHVQKKPQAKVQRPLRPRPAESAKESTRHSLKRFADPDETSSTSTTSSISPSAPSLITRPRSPNKTAPAPRVAGVPRAKTARVGASAPLSSRPSPHIAEESASLADLGLDEVSGSLLSLRQELLALPSSAPRALLVCESRGLAAAVARALLAEAVERDACWSCARYGERLPRITWLDESCAPSARLRRDSERAYEARRLPLLGEVVFKGAYKSRAQDALQLRAQCDVVLALLREVREAVLVTAPHALTAPFALAQLTAQLAPSQQRSLILRHTVLPALTDSAIAEGIARAPVLSSAAVAQVHARREAEYLWQRNASAALASRSALDGRPAPYALLALAQPIVSRAIARQLHATHAQSPAPVHTLRAVLPDGVETVQLRVSADGALAGEFRECVVRSVAPLEETTLQPPTLLDTESAVGEIEAALGLGADEALKHLRALYELRVLTAPRSTSRSLPSSWSPRYNIALRQLASELSVRVDGADTVTLPASAFSSDDVGEYALVPLLPLSEVARRMLSTSAPSRTAVVFRLLVARTLQAALPAAHLARSHWSVDFGRGVECTCDFELPVRLGWRAALVSTLFPELALLTPAPPQLLSSAVRAVASSSVLRLASSTAPLDAPLHRDDSAAPALLTVREWLTVSRAAVPSASSVQLLRWLAELVRVRLVTVKTGAGGGLGVHPRVLRVVQNALGTALAQPQYLEGLEHRIAQSDSPARLAAFTRALHGDLKAMVPELVPAAPLVPFDRYYALSERDRAQQHPTLKRLACPSCHERALVDFVFHFACVTPDCAFLVRKDALHAEHSLTLAQLEMLISRGRLEVADLRRALRLERIGARGVMRAVVEDLAQEASA